MKLIRALRLFLILFVFCQFQLAVAQMPGMDPDEDKPAAAELSKPAPVDANVGKLKALYLKFFGEDSPYKPVILTILTLLILLQVKAYFGRKMRTYVETKAFHEKNAKSFMKVWEIIWKFIIALMVIMAMTGSLRLLGLTAGFLGMMLGWSLQQPVTGIAAWLMIVLKKPFRIGDRVIIAGITGDVTDITLTHVILNQVGGSIGGEERSGRGILIPNAILFQHIIINYTLEQSHVLSEIPVRLNFDVDWELAKEIMIKAASEATHKVIEETGNQPVVRVEFLDWGILARLRFHCVPTEREKMCTEVVEILLKEFRKEYPKIRFAVPHSRIDYSGDEPRQFTPPNV